MTVMPPWPRIHLFFFSLLWFLPVGYSLLFQKGIPFFPQGVNRLAAFCPQSGSKPKVWESYYVEAQAGNISNEWVPLNLADFSALQAVDSGRSRLEQMIANSERQTGGDKVRAAAAKYLGGRYREIYPQAPAITSVRFSAVDQPVGGRSLASPAGVWTDPPLGMMSQAKPPPRVMGTYPIGRSVPRINPLYFDAPPEFDDAALIEWVGASPAVEIDLSDTQVTGAGLAILAKHTPLRTLRLRDLKVKDADLNWIAGMPELRGLDLSGTGVTDALLPELAKLGQLTELRMARVKITRSAAPILAGLHELTILDVSETELAATTLMQLGTWPKLRTLVIEKLDLDKLGQVGGVPHGMLVGVDLSHAVIGKSGLRVLRLFPMVQKLNLEGAKIVDSDLGPLSVLTNLQTVNLSTTGVTELGVKSLLAASPALRSVQWGKEGEKLSNAPKKTPPVRGSALARRAAQAKSSPQTKGPAAQAVNPPANPTPQAPTQPLPAKVPVKPIVPVPTSPLPPTVGPAIKPATAPVPQPQTNLPTGQPQTPVPQSPKP